MSYRSPSLARSCNRSMGGKVATRTDLWRVVIPSEARDLNWPKCSSLASLRMTSFGDAMHAARETIAQARVVELHAEVTGEKIQREVSGDALGACRIHAQPGGLL